MFILVETLISLMFFLLVQISVLKLRKWNYYQVMSMYICNNIMYFVITYVAFQIIRTVSIRPVLMVQNVSMVIQATFQTPFAGKLWIDIV